MKKHMAPRTQLSKKWFIFVAIFLLLVVALPITISVFKTKQQTQTHAAAAGFVYRDGKKLMLNGAPYQFVGFNAYGAISGCEGSSWSSSQMDSYFQSLPPASMTRVWAFESNGTSGMDQLIASAEKNNQKVILTLENDLADCTNSGAKNNAWYQSGYKGQYLAWVKQVATKYKDSPAVGMYEAINEAGQAQGEGKLDGATMKAFYDATTNAIKSVDPNHLVGTGDNAEFNYSGGASAYQTAISGTVDVASLHDYEADYGGSKTAVSTHFSSTKSAADANNKPIIIGEMNESANSVGTATRATNVKGKIQAYLAGGAGGVLIWNRTYGNYNDGEGYNVASADPLVNIIKSWVISGLNTTPGAGTTTAPVPTNITPTFYCAGGCPTGVDPTQSAGEPTNITGLPAPTETDQEPTLTAAPCEQSITAAARHGRRGGRHHGHGGMMQFFFQFLINLLNKLFELLGLPPIDFPGNPGNPGNPGQPEPTTGEPQPTTPGQPQPTLPCIQPTDAPAEPTATSAPGVTTQPTTPPTSEIVPPAGGPWTLIANMSDEFDGTTVDTSKWRFTSSAEADCEGDGIALESGCRNPGNQQMEFNWGKNCTVAQGILTITAKKETHGSSAWTSCMLHSANKAKEMYMEARVKMPGIDGFWPGFWTWEGPQNEVDVFEYYTAAKQFDMTNHTGGGGHCSAPAGFDPTTDYHVYAAEIYGGSVKYYIDGKAICTTSGAPADPVSILLDLFVHDQQQQAADSVTMETDYIRAWKK